MEAASTHPADLAARFGIGSVRCDDQQLAQAACLGARQGDYWPEADDSLFDEKREKRSLFNVLSAAVMWPTAVP